jgi:AcrR family transcriptional regulator
MAATPTRTDDRRGQRRAATVDRIVAAAWRLSGERGLGGWTLRDLGAAVGMRAPSLYEYVESKAALYDLLFADGYRALLRRVEAMPRSTDPLEDLRAGAHLFVAFCVEDPARCALLFLRPVPGFEPSPESYALAQDVLGQLATALEAAGHGDPHEVDLWTAVLTGLATQQTSNDPGGERWTRLVDTAVDRFLGVG